MLNVLVISNVGEFLPFVCKLSDSLQVLFSWISNIDDNLILQDKSLSEVSVFYSKVESSTALLFCHIHYFIECS